MTRLDVLGDPDNRKWVLWFERRHDGRAVAQLGLLRYLAGTLEELVRTGALSKATTSTIEALLDALLVLARRGEPWREPVTFGCGALARALGEVAAELAAGRLELPSYSYTLEQTIIVPDAWLGLVPVLDEHRACEASNELRLAWGF